MDFFSPLRLAILTAYCVNSVDFLPDFLSVVFNRNRWTSDDDSSGRTSTETWLFYRYFAFSSTCSKKNSLKTPESLFFCFWNFHWLFLQKSFHIWSNGELSNSQHWVSEKSKENEKNTILLNLTTTSTCTIRVIKQWSVKAAKKFSNWKVFINRNPLFSGP